MWHYQPPLRDMQFVIEHWLDAPTTWQHSEAFDFLDAPLASQVLEQAGMFCREVLAPLNAGGDRQGCRFEDGRVSTPEGFKAAYRAWTEGGWPALACSPDHGGQGLPQVLDAALQEMLYASNHGWAMYTGIVHGAYRCLKAHAPQWLQDRYVPDLVSGKALATMCLTEPQAGSDVGLLRSRAQPQADGSHALSGNKLFISGGEHDLCDDIVHLVLARLPDAPAGSRGISLFLVPRRLDDGRLNAVRCDGIEHKMGIKGSATCSLVFEQAQGWLIGQPHQGLAAMFVMMNSARLHVGLQGLGHAEAAWQNARQYSAERRQMRAPRRPDGVAASAADPLHYHPAMRRTLLELRASSEGLRALGYWAGHLLDQADHGPTPAARAQAVQLTGLLTPIIKAFFTERGFQLASQALQVFGGYGYVAEFGIEQTLRDSRIAMIYEGSNEIQANDLLLRKVLGDNGEALQQLMSILRDEAQLAVGSPACRALGEGLQQRCQALEQAWQLCTAQAALDAEYPYRAATSFLQLCGLTLLAFAWTRAARVAQGLAEDNPLRTEKLQTAQFFFNWLLPEADRHVAGLHSARSALPFLA